MMPLVRDVDEMLRPDRSLTAAGVCYLLRDLLLPPNFTEAERALRWLVRAGRAVHVCTGEFGPEYRRAAQ